MGFLGFGSSSSSEASTSVASRASTPDTVAVNPPHKQEQAVNPLNPKGIKPCCACPETKAARDDCFLRSSADEADIKCSELLEAHKACMRSYGFKV